MKKKILVILLVLSALMLTACAPKEIAPEEGKKWAESNGYVLARDYNLSADALTSATQTGEGGLNFGDVDWTDDLKKAAIREYLKGDASELYEDGFNHRNMMQIAVSYNNEPVIGSVEFAMNDDFSFTAGSEKNTEKLNAMLVNPKADLYWTLQLRGEDGMPSYFYAYGVEVQGNVVFYDWEKLSGDELTKALGDIRNYFKSMGAAYAKYFDASADGYMDDETLRGKMKESGTTYYKIVPEKIVITSPYMLFMGNQGAYVVINTATGEWVPYTLVSSDLLDKMLDQVKTVYPDATFFNTTQLYPMLSQMIPGFSQQGGLKTQAVLTF